VEIFLTVWPSVVAVVCCCGVINVAALTVSQAFTELFRQLFVWSVLSRYMFSVCTVCYSLASSEIIVQTTVEVNKETCHFIQKTPVDIVC